MNVFDFQNPPEARHPLTSIEWHLTKRIVTQTQINCEDLKPALGISRTVSPAPTVHCLPRLHRGLTDAWRGRSLDFATLGLVPVEQ